MALCMALPIRLLGPATLFTRPCKPLEASFFNLPNAALNNFAPNAKGLMGAGMGFTSTLWEGIAIINPVGIYRCMGLGEAFLRKSSIIPTSQQSLFRCCLLYTSDAADDLL